LLGMVLLRQAYLMCRSIICLAQALDTLDGAVALLIVGCMIEKNISCHD